MILHHLVNKKIHCPRMEEMKAMVGRWKLLYNVRELLTT